MSANDGLRTLLVDLARQQDSVRLAVSTAPEQLGLTNATLLHVFHSHEWCA